jgi:site-specific DNA-methyltransferase (adenine-specific)/modification methylase
LKDKILSDSIDLIFADPPYNLSGKNLSLIGNKTGGDFNKINEKWDIMNYEEYCQFTFEWINLCKKVLKKTGSIYISCSFHNLGEVIMNLKKNNFFIKNIITWKKTNAMPNITKRTFTHSTEFIVWAVKGSNWIFNYKDIKRINNEVTKEGEKKQMRDVWEIPVVQGHERLKDKNNKTIHPAQKPEELLKRIITASSNENNVVLDPFAGTGTTLAVAEKLHRYWIGIEKERKYIDAINVRLVSIRDTLFENDKYNYDVTSECDYKLADAVNSFT